MNYPDPILNDLTILCFGYREWSLAIYNNISNNQLLNKHRFITTSNAYFVNLDFIEKIKPDIILFYGWSEIIPEEIVKTYICLMLHPSALPKYKGGSPIQNQIINNVKTTRVTIFKMTSEIDSGDIVGSKEINLEGDILDIFARIEEVGAELTIDILTNGFHPKKQNGISSFFKRRLPSDSEISIQEIKKESSSYLYNKIRMLTGPYPTAYINCSDGKKLFIKKASLQDDE